MDTKSCLVRDVQRKCKRRRDWTMEREDKTIMIQPAASYFKAISSCDCIAHMLWLEDAWKCQPLQVRICKRTECFIRKGLHLLETYTLLLHPYYTFQGRKNRALFASSREVACLPCSQGIYPSAPTVAKAAYLVLILLPCDFLSFFFSRL